MLEKHISEKYKVIKLLNNGPYAKVYHAKDSITGKSVAIKALQQGCTPKSVDLEIQAMRRLKNHPHIINLVEVLVDEDDNVYIVTEYAKRGDLYETIVRNGGKFNEDLSRHYFRHIVSAVKHCHSRGVYHRDIKPENILLDDQWRVKLSDFGLCGVSETGIGRFWDACGTVEYAAPEVVVAVAGGEGYDGEKADVWSCGVVLYVMVTGRMPFEGEDVKGMWRKMMKAEFGLPKWVSPGLKWLLMRMLDPNPECRISVEEIMEDGWFCQGYDDNNVDDDQVHAQV